MNCRPTKTEEEMHHLFSVNCLFTVTCTGYKIFMWLTKMRNIMEAKPAGGRE